MSLLLRSADGRTRTVEMERARAREVTNPVRYRLRSLSNGARKVGYVALSAFNARAAPELRVRHCLLVRSFCRACCPVPYRVLSVVACAGGSCRPQGTGRH